MKVLIENFMEAAAWSHAEPIVPKIAPPSEKEACLRGKLLIR